MHLVRARELGLWAWPSVGKWGDAGARTVLANARPGYLVFPDEKLKPKILAPRKPTVLSSQGKVGSSFTVLVVGPVNWVCIARAHGTFQKQQGKEKKIRTKNVSSKTAKKYSSTLGNTNVFLDR